MGLFCGEGGVCLPKVRFLCNSSMVGFLSESFLLLGLGFVGGMLNCGIVGL